MLHKDQSGLLDIPPMRYDPLGSEQCPIVSLLPLPNPSAGLRRLMEESALPGAVNNIIQRFQRWNIVTVPLYTSYIFLQRVNFLLRTGLANGRHSLGDDAGLLLPAFIVLLCSPDCFNRKVSDCCALTNEKPGRKETVQWDVRHKCFIQ